MKKFNVNNGNKKIGHGILNENNIKNLKKGMTITLAAFCMGLMLASCKGKGSNIVNKPINTINNIIPDKIDPYDGTIPSPVYSIYLSDGSIVYCDESQLYKYGYIVDRDLDREVAWCEEQYQQLMRKCERTHTTVDSTIDRLIHEHNDVMSLYEELTSGPKSIVKTHYMEEQLDNYERLLYQWIYPVKGGLYTSNIITLLEYERRQSLIERAYFIDDYHALYTVKKGDTLIDIVSKYANDKEQLRNIIEKIIEINNIDPDNIKEGQIIILPMLDGEDLDRLGYTLTDDDIINQYKDYFEMIQEEGLLQTLTGDKQSEEKKEEINDRINEFLNEPNNSDSIEYAKRIVAEIEVNFGVDGPSLIAYRSR